MFTSFVSFCFKMMLVTCALNSVLFRTELKSIVVFFGITLRGLKGSLIFFFLFTHLKKGWSNQTFICNLVIINLLCLYLILHPFEALPQVISQRGLPSQSCCFFERWISTHLVPLSFLSIYISRAFDEISRMVVMEVSPVREKLLLRNEFIVLPFALKLSVVWLEKEITMWNILSLFHTDWRYMGLTPILAGIPNS